MCTPKLLGSVLLNPQDLPPKSPGFPPFPAPQPPGIFPPFPPGFAPRDSQDFSSRIPRICPQIPRISLFSCPRISPTRCRFPRPPPHPSLSCAQIWGGVPGRDIGTIPAGTNPQTPPGGTSLHPGTVPNLTETTPKTAPNPCATPGAVTPSPTLPPASGEHPEPPKIPPKIPPGELPESCTCPRC